MTNCIKNKNQKGFTLTELIIVIVIIGILAAVLIPSLSGYIKKAKKSAAEQDAMTMYKEVLADIDVTDTDTLEANFVIAIGGTNPESADYYVFIEKGALQTAKTIDKKDLKSNESINITVSETSSDNTYFLICDNSFCMKNAEGKFVTADGATKITPTTATKIKTVEIK